MSISTRLRSGRTKTLASLYIYLSPLIVTNIDSGKGGSEEANVYKGGRERKA